MPAMTRFWEWLGRVIMLVLAGMITLSIIGAIAAIPSQSTETRLRVEPQRDWSQPTPRTEPLPPRPLPRAVPESRPAAPPPPRARTQVIEAPAPAPPPPTTAADWLEAITYALLALVGIGVGAVLLLWRAVHHWRRSADALEALASRKA
jgi:hypothetical protein